MPSLNLSARFPEDWVICLGLAREVMRPRLDSMRVAIETFGNVLTISGVNNNYLSATSGNPELRPYRANAADLSFEKYFGIKGYVSLQLYYKYFDTFVVEQNLPNVPFDFTGFPIPAPFQTTDPSNINTYMPPRNHERLHQAAVHTSTAADVWRRTRRHPSSRRIRARDRRFWADRRRVLTQSKVHIYPGAPAQNLPGYSKWVANGTAFFEKWGFNARASLRYRSGFQVRCPASPRTMCSVRRNRRQS
jgi:iron complex outermembrane receptor protein